MLIVTAEHFPVQLLL